MKTTKFHFKKPPEDEDSSHYLCPECDEYYRQNPSDGFCPKCEVNGDIVMLSEITDEEREEMRQESKDVDV